MMRYLTRKPAPVIETPVEPPITQAPPAEPQAASIEDLTAQENAAAAEHHYATGGRVEYAEGTDMPSMTNIGEDVVKDAKGIYEKYAPKIAKGAATTLRVIGTPAVSAALYVHDIIDDLKEAANEGSVTASKALDAFVGKGEKGLYFMLPELAKDVVTNPIVSKMLQLGSFGRVATPVGAALTTAGIGKDLYNQYQDFKKLPPEQKEMIKKQLNYGATDEMGNRTEQKNGGRIGYAEGSKDDLPTLKEQDIGEPLSKYKSYSELELLKSLAAKHPTGEILEENILELMPRYEPKDTIPKGSRPVMPNVYDRRPSDGILRLSKGGIVWKK
jgi:hypothetical protein